MAAFMLLLMLVLVTVNLAFTVKMWRCNARDYVREKPRIKIPRGKRMDKTKNEANAQLDVNALVAETLAAMEIDAEESGESETQLTPEQIAEIAQRAMNGAR